MWENFNKLSLNNSILKALATYSTSSASIWRQPAQKTFSAEMQLAKNHMICKSIHMKTWKYIWSIIKGMYIFFLFTTLSLSRYKKPVFLPVSTYAKILGEVRILWFVSQKKKKNIVISFWIIFVNVLVVRLATLLHRL